MKHLLRCNSCRIYTMKDPCPKCGNKSLSPKPPKYSPVDKYAKYRRVGKLEQRKKEGLL
ncbi:MAG: RNA-protein complex protein Nop10 [Nanoarchaeota archaeon]|nr:RNA-protein complex protein Nop10 [Nanoarchaeota archaeon]